MGPKTRKSAFITGASRGIGKALALDLAHRGYDLWICGRVRETLLATVAEISTAAPDINVLSAVLDVGDDNTVRTALLDGVRELGRVDVVVNNAGMNLQGTAEISGTDLEALFRTNVFGPWNVVRTLAPVLKEQRFGHLFTISSICGVHAFPTAGAYCATKFANCAMSDALFRELTPFGVKVSAICPSWVDTDMAKHAPFGSEKKIAPADIAAAVQFLLALSPTAAVRQLVVDCTADFL